jgi:hypothetical protein
LNFFCACSQPFCDSVCGLVTPTFSIRSPDSLASISRYALSPCFSTPSICRTAATTGLWPTRWIILLHSASHLTLRGLRAKLGLGRFFFFRLIGNLLETLWKTTSTATLVPVSQSQICGSAFPMCQILTEGWTRRASEIMINILHRNLEEDPKIGFSLMLRATPLRV